MTIQLAITFAAFLVEYEYLVTFYQSGHYFANDFCTFHGGNTYGDGTFIVHQKDFLKFYCRTCLCILDVVYEQLLASFCLKLLTVDFYNCVHCL